METLKKCLVPATVFLLLLRHHVSLFFDTDYWVSFHVITHLCILLVAWRMLIKTEFGKWEIVASKLLVLFVSQDIIDRTFFGIYTYAITDIAVFISTVWIFYKVLKAK